MKLYPPRHMTPGRLNAYGPDDSAGREHWLLEDELGDHGIILGDEPEARANAIAHAALPQCLAALVKVIEGAPDAVQAARSALLDAGYTETKPI